MLFPVIMEDEEDDDDVAVAETPSSAGRTTRVVSALMVRRSRVINPMNDDGDDGQAPLIYDPAYVHVKLLTYLSPMTSQEIPTSMNHHRSAA